MKIVARGDCCSRRAVMMNPELFGAAPVYLDNEKVPTGIFLDRTRGLTADPEVVARHVDLSAAHPLNIHYFYSQFSTATCAQARPDLIMLDSYADMNFNRWRSRDGGWMMWVEQGLIRDREAFERDFEFVGRQTYEESLDFSLRVIDYYRQGDTSIPVLFLSQPVAFYPNLEARAEFEYLGRDVAAAAPNAYFGGVPEREELETADLDELGRTLHFQAATYARMVAKTIDAGLALEAVRARGFGRSVACHDEKGDLITLDELLAELKLPAAEQVPAAPVERGPFENCPPGCGRFVRSRIRKGFDSHIERSEVNEGWLGRYLPMVIEESSFGTLIERKAAERDASSADAFVVAPFQRKDFKVETAAIRRGTPGYDPGRRPGRMLEAVRNRRFRPACPRHWSAAFGLFQRNPDDGLARLTAYVLVHRTGDVLFTARPERLTSIPADRADALIVEFVRLALTGSEPFAGVSRVYCNVLLSDRIDLNRWAASLGASPVRLFDSPPAVAVGAALA